MFRPTTRACGRYATLLIAVPILMLPLALPAYAAPSGNVATATSPVSAESQTVKVSGELDAVAAARDGYTTTSASEMSRLALAQSYRAYTGPSVGDLLANPPYPSFSLSAVVDVAMQYQGTPYRFGGADPSGLSTSAEF